MGAAVPGVSEPIESSLTTVSCTTIGDDLAIGRIDPSSPIDSSLTTASSATIDSIRIATKAAGATIPSLDQKNLQTEPNFPPEREPNHSELVQARNRLADPAMLWAELERHNAAATDPTDPTDLTDRFDEMRRPAWFLRLGETLFGASLRKGRIPAMFAPQICASLVRAVPLWSTLLVLLGSSLLAGAAHRTPASRDADSRRAALSSPIRASAGISISDSAGAGPIPTRRAGNDAAPLDLRPERGSHKSAQGNALEPTKTNGKQPTQSPSPGRRRTWTESPLGRPPLLDRSGPRLASSPGTAPPNRNRHQ